MCQREMLRHHSDSGPGAIYFSRFQQSPLRKGMLMGVMRAKMMVIVMATTMMMMMPGTGVSAGNGFKTEYCQNENFKATCDANQIIMMTSAQYGRMHIGKCVRKDYGYIGCKKDVLGVTDLLCSGRHICSIRVPNEMFDYTKPCPDDFKSYFETSYDCLTVVQVPRHRCRTPGQVTLNSPQGAIASVTTSEIGCGSVKSPWVIRVNPGQRINITLIDFSHAARGQLGELFGNVPDTDTCYGYATFKEQLGKEMRSDTLCGQHTRESVAYVSKSNKVQIVVMETHSEEDFRYFLLNYQAIGCSTPGAPEHGWLGRDGDRLTIGCNGTGQTTHLICNGSHWDGDLPACAKTGAALGNVSSPFAFTMSYEMAVVVIVAIAIVVASFILCFGIICLKRIREKPHAGRPPFHPDTYSDPNRHFDAETDDNQSKRYPEMPWNYDQAYRTQGENVYASIKDWPMQDTRKSPAVEICTCPRDMSTRDPHTTNTTTTTTPTVARTYSSLEHTVTTAAAAAAGQKEASRRPSGKPEAIMATPHREQARQYFVLDPNSNENNVMIHDAS